MYNAVDVHNHFMETLVLYVNLNISQICDMWAPRISRISQVFLISRRIRTFQIFRIFCIFLYFLKNYNIHKIIILHYVLFQHGTIVFMSGYYCDPYISGRTCVKYCIMLI